MKLQKGDKVYIKSKSKGKHLIDFRERWGYDIPQKKEVSFTKTEFTIEYIDHNEQCYVILGDWFTEDDLSPIKKIAQQLKLF
uniref:Uncharacterized protein n=1 Tax=viral metagenome TaxID=1070528 RepID=A0A6M3JTZ3_9ZZZZ